MIPPVTLGLLALVLAGLWSGSMAAQCHIPRLLLDILAERNDGLLDHTPSLPVLHPEQPWLAIPGLVSKEEQTKAY